MAYVNTMPAAIAAAAAQLEGIGNSFAAESSAAAAPMTAVAPAASDEVSILPKVMPVVPKPTIT
jgi:PE family